MADIYAEVTAVGIQGLSATSETGAGATGATGPAGATGPQGPAGASGVGGGSGDGATGATGPQGASGAAGDRYHTTSTSTFTIGGAGTVTVTTDDLDLDYSTAQTIILAFNASNHQHGRVISYNPATGELVFNKTDASGSGTYSSWEINLDGAVGIQGASGSTGLTGASGVAGSSGAQGASGVQGIDGASGYIGSDGATGPQGASGIDGASGYVGSDGATGPSGAAGATGTAGATGSTGLTGATGVQGASGVDGTSFTIVGTVADSSLLPVPYTGSVGDGYITENLGDLWVWDGAAWLDAGPIVGPAGATGTAGATGVRGATGFTGATGVSGASGISGASGYVGSDGATGPQGIQGASGVTGASGISGASGYVGSDGASGVAGATGQTGATGAGLEVTTFTTSSTNEVIIDDWDTTTDRSVKYEMQITSGSDYSASELRLLHDDANVYISEYAILGNILGTFSTHFSPLSNSYSSPDIDAGLSYWTNNDLVIYTTDNETILALLSILPSTTVAFNSGAASTTLSTKFAETSPGIYEATTSTSRSPLLLVTNISWTGTGNCELRFTPINSVTTLKYIRTGIPV